jgi:hypothetical protein
MKFEMLYYFFSGYYNLSVSYHDLPFLVEQFKQNENTSYLKKFKNELEIAKQKVDSQEHVEIQTLLVRSGRRMNKHQIKDMVYLLNREMER